MDKPESYQSEWIGYGIAIGVAFGIALDNLPLGIVLGIAVGVSINSYKLSSREKTQQNN